MRSFPFDSIVTFEQIGGVAMPIFDRNYGADDLSDVNARFFSNGVFMDDGGSLKVAPGSGMTVNVSPGWCNVNGRFGNEGSVRTLSVQAASSSDRIDTVVLRSNLASDARKIDLYVVQGNSGDTPSRPNLTRTDTVYELGIADLYIPANTTEVKADRITDTRLEAARCGAVTPLLKVDTTTFYDQGQAAIDREAAKLEAQTDEAVRLSKEILEGSVITNELIDQLWASA